MYESFFGLKHSPFNMTPDPDLLFWTDAHREALAGLTYAVTCRKGFVVLTGPAGTGKTTLLRKLLDAAPVSMSTSFIYNPKLTASEFLEMALADFDMPGGNSMNKAQRLFRFEQFLRSANRDGRTAVLIIDEAHNLSPEVLEEVRLLTNFETASQKLLQIVLAGQPALDDMLNRDDLLQVKQRVAAHVRTRPLTREELPLYLEFRWTKAGASGPLPITREAIDLISECARGIPRSVNGICDNALISAYGAGRKIVGPADILEVARDLDLRVPSDTAVESLRPGIAAADEITKPNQPADSVTAASDSNGFTMVPFRAAELDESELPASPLRHLAEMLGIRFRRRTEITR